MTAIAIVAGIIVGYIAVMYGVSWLCCWIEEDLEKARRKGK